MHGINPDDLTVKKVVEDGIAYITIEGKSKIKMKNLGNCEMEVKSKDGLYHINNSQETY